MKRAESVEALHEVAQRFLRVFRLDDTRREQYAGRPSSSALATSLRVLTSRSHSTATRGFIAWIRSTARETTSGFAVVTLTSAADEFRWFDGNVFRRQLGEGLRLRDVVRTGDDLETEFLATRNALRHFLPGHLALAVVDQRPGGARLQEGLRR